jgi:hypothetical protein
MFVEVNTVEAPDLSALNGGCDSGGGEADNGGLVTVDECVPYSAPHQGPVQEPSLVEETEEQSTTGNLGGATRVVHLMEDQVYAVLNKEKEMESCQWVLDTGALNHMSGSQAAFSGISGRTVGTMRFADGSVVFIEGVGTVVYECKNGEHRTLTGVYYIPQLWTSIISIGQLDECGYEVRIRSGVLSLRDENQKLLARIQRGLRRLYKVELRIARPVCLLAHTGDEAWRCHARFGHVNFTSLKKMAST